MNINLTIKKHKLAESLSWLGSILLFTVLINILTPQTAMASGSVAVIGRNIIDSISTVPGLISGLSYLLAMVLGTTAIIDLKNHAENPSNTPLRKPIIKFIAGGMLIALPIMYDAMQNSIDPTNGQFLINVDLMQYLGLDDSNVSMASINGVFANIINSVGDLPGLVSGITYLAAMVLGVIGILKLKEHVENPEQVPIREGVIRLLIAGALFALPAVLYAAYDLIAGNLQPVNIVDNSNIMSSAETSETCEGNTDNGGFNGTIGGVICLLTDSSNALPAVLAAASYLFGIVLVVWALFKIRDHVLNPGNVPIWDGISRLIAGGAFFALPILTYAIRASLVQDGAFSGSRVTGFNESINGGCDNGLDSVLFCFMDDVFGPMGIAINVFAIVAGIILIMIGISRLLKGAQEGARAPGGFGTIMTFITGGALVSSHGLIRTFSASLFADDKTATFAQLAFTGGMTGNELQHAHTVISAILKFIFVIGLISFIRGIFIIRNVAEGNGQASIMAGITHMVGGALAVNLGPLMAAVQATLGITGYGITFS